MKTKFTLMALLLAGLTMPSLQAQEITKVLLPDADTFIRNDNKNHGDEVAMEIDGMAGPTDFFGLIRFTLPLDDIDLDNYDIEKAELRLVNVQNKGDRNIWIYDYNKEFAENTSFTTETEDYVASILATEHIAEFQAKGKGGQWAADDKVAFGEEYNNVAGWTSYIDLTDFVKAKIQDENQLVSLLLQRQQNNSGNKMKFATKEAVDIENPGINTNGGTPFTFKKEDLVPQLTLTLTPKAMTSPDIYILGFFNWFEASDEYKLSQDDEDSNQYSLYFIPVGGYEFMFNFEYGDKFLVPVDAEDDEEVTFDSDGLYTTKFEISDDDSWSWVNYEWNGGEINVIIDLSTNTLIIQKESEDADIWYLRGAFNDYDPNGEETWALNPVEGEEMVYSGEFEIPAGQLSFNLLSPQGWIFAPGNYDEVYPEVMTYTDGVYTSSMGEAYNEEEEGYYWSYPSWEGGVVEITVDLNEGLTVKILDDYSAIKKIESVNGEDVIYNLQGVRVNNPVKGGIYVINGKKVILK